MRHTFKLLAGTCLVAVQPVAHAGLISGFEAGLSGWDALGDVSVQTSAIGLVPTEGAHEAFISTMCDFLAPPAGGCNTSTNEHPYSGVSSPYAGYARAFLGLPFDGNAFLQQMPDSGSPSPSDTSTGESGALKTRFYAEAPGTVSFDWNRIGRDNDTAYVSLWSDDNSYRLNDWVYLPTDDSFHNGFAPSNVDLCARYYTTTPGEQCDAFGQYFYNVETGWSTKSIAVSAPGWYWIGFGLGEVAEGSSPTVLALDNVRFTAAAPVPEPETCAMWLLGMGALWFTARRGRAGAARTAARAVAAAS
jgi:hypothetical protein